jgi:transposase-like protein
MQEKRNDSELRLTVTGTRRDGRRRYDLQSKRALARACPQPGVSLAGMALKHGVNANLLRRWVVSYQQASDAAAPTVALADPADVFVPVVLTGSRATQIVKPMCPAPDAVIIPPSAIHSTTPCCCMRAAVRSQRGCIMSVHSTSSLPRNR